MQFGIHHFKVKPEGIFLPFSGKISDISKKKNHIWTNQRKIETTGAKTCCAKIEIGCKVGKEKNVSLDAKRRKYLSGLVGTYQGKQGWSVREG